MMQNSLERLLAGVAAALREDIAPALEDEFARGQALAGAEILENLVPRVQWRVDDAEAVIALIRPLLSEPPPEGDRDAHLLALADAQRAGRPAMDVSLALLEREVAHLKAARAVAKGDRQ
jgi:hypothetical protein